MRTPLAMVMVTVCWLAATPGLAESTAGEAKAAFEQGKAAFGEDKFVEAAVAFRRAHELRPNWRLLYNIAQSEAAAKQPGLALQAFEAYLAQGGDDVSVERRDECVAEVERLRAMVGEVVVVAPNGAIIFVDSIERERAPLPGPMMVAAGMNHDIRIELDGVVLLERPVRVSSGKRVKVDAGGDSPGPESPAIEPGDSGTDSLDEETSPLVIGGWVSVGVGAALLIGGAITGGMTLSLDGDLDKRCNDEVCTESDREDVDRLDTLALTTDVLIGVGAAAAVTGVVLLIIGYGGEEEESAGDVAFAPLIGPGIAGAGIQGRF